jgi:cytochrome P450
LSLMPANPAPGRSERDIYLIVATEEDFIVRISPFPMLAASLSIATMLSELLTASVAIVIITLVYEYIRERKLPPGPRRLPIIGNLHQAPRYNPWQTFDAWMKQYGPVISVRFGGSTVIVIGDPNIAHDLLDKRANIYSDRPRMVMAGELLTKGMHMLLRRFDGRYLLHQRLQAPLLSPRASSTYIPLQDMESKFTLVRFLDSNDYRGQYERFAASLIYGLAYGYRIVTGREQSLKDAHRVQENFALLAQVGMWVADLVPALNCLPAPFTPWKKTAAELYQLEEKLHLGNLKAGMESPAWTWSKAMKASRESKDMGEVEIAYSLGILADAGLDTTVMVLEIFTLAAVLYPDVVEAAHKELDDTIGQDRLPTLGDKEKLPYICAIIEETFRWRHITPGGIPHATTKEDWYMGYRIPKGATVVPNFWSMRTDVCRYENPNMFRPERWIDQPGGVNNFGYGRRVCTGRHIADNSLFLLISRLLWAYDIRAGLDANGEVAKIDDTILTSGFVWRPKPFPVVFTPRSTHHQAFILEEWDESEKDLTSILTSIREEQIRVGINVRAPNKA